MADSEVQFSSGASNTMVAIALVAATLSLALNFFNLNRTNQLAAVIAVDKIRAAQAQGE